jgi:hypothetical protein
MSAAFATCPDEGYYQADRIINFDDADALAVAVQEAIAKCGANSSDLATATSLSKMAARQILSSNEYGIRAALDVLKAIARRMAVLAGELSIVLVSPGFYTPVGIPGLQDVEDRAVRSGVVINTLDARGLYTPTGFDASDSFSGNARSSAAKRAFATEQQRVQGEVLLEMADATGGRSFRNSNDFDGGFRRLAERPDATYLLGFSPGDENADGTYHRLKVTVKTRKGLDIQARRGYLAAKEAGDPALDAKREIENALLTRDEIREIPVTVQAVAGKTANGIALLTHVDIKALSFKQEAGHSREKLHLVFGFFDANGNLSGLVEQDFPLDFTDSELAARSKAGIDLRSNLEPKSGSRFLRLILRDEAGQMSTVNRSLGM